MIPLLLIVWSVISIADAGSLLWPLALLVGLLLGKFGRLIVYVWAFVAGMITGGWLILFVILVLIDFFGDDS